jgi:UDP-N-acetylmuramyl pentapeptide synthase
MMHAYIKELIAVEYRILWFHIPEGCKEMLISLLSKILRVLYKNLQPIIAAFNFLIGITGSNGKRL